MILKELKKDFLKYAKGFCFSENFSIFCTGQRAFICDKALNPIYTVEKLSYVSHAYVSLDEKSLLLVSNGNIFYLVDLTDFSVKKHTVRGKYSYNLEGRGCWSFDGKSLYINVCNPDTLNSALRRYSLSDDTTYEDMLAEKYWLVSIKAIKELNKYLLIGLDRKKAKCDRSDCWSVIWFDGTSFEEWPIEKTDVRDNLIGYADYEAATNTVILYDQEKTFRCDLQGEIIENISLVTSEKVTSSFSNALSGLKNITGKHGSLKSLSASLGLKNVSVNGINKFCLSSDGKKYYVGTRAGLFITDAETKAVLKKEAVNYGVQNITEISPNVIAVSTWNGVKIFEIIE